MAAVTAPLTPERLEEIRDAALRDYAAHASGIYLATPLVAHRLELLAEVDRLRAQVAALLTLFTYESLGEPGRLHARLIGDVEVTDEVTAALASGDEVQPPPSTAGLVKRLRAIEDEYRHGEAADPGDGVQP